MNYDKLEKIYYKDRNQYNNIYNLRYNSESALHFDFSICGNPSFMIINSDILNLVSDIYELNNQLNFIYGMLPGLAIYQYTKTCLIDEIRITNDIEGVYSTKKEINDLIENKDTKDIKGLKGIINKYFLLRKEDIPLNSCEDMRNLYNELVLDEVVNSNPHNRPDGSYFRTGEVNVISKRNKLVHSGVTPESKIVELMDKALLLLKDGDISFFIRVAVFHYIFGYIHPFYDGNGRMSRFISSYLLSNRLNVLVSYRLSYSIKNDIDRYHKAFIIANEKKNKGDLTPFVMTFLEFVVNSLNMLIKSLKDRLSKYTFYENIASEHLEKGKIDVDGYKIIGILVQNEMFGDNLLDIKDVAETLNVSKATATKHLKELESKYSFISKTVISKKYCYSIDLDLFEKII